MRHKYGGGVADWVFTFGGGGTVTRAASTVVTFYPALTGGTQITDLRSLSGASITSVTSDANGQVPEFYGPVGGGPLAADAAGGAGPRTWLLPTDADRLPGEVINAGHPFFAVGGHAYDASGATDNLPNITNAMSVASAGDQVFLPGPTCGVAGPIVPPVDGLHFFGQKGCSQSGNDSGTPQGTVIKATSAWSPGAQPVNGMFTLLNGIDGTRIRDMWLDGRTAPAGVTLNGIACYGSADATAISHVGVRGVNGNGIHTQNDASANFPDGWTIETMIIQSCGGHGVDGKFADGTMWNIHSQGNTGHGFNLTSGGNLRLTGCRADLNNYGFNIEIDAGGGGYYSHINLIGCGTQRNNAYGLRAGNGGSSPNALVEVTGGSFEGDGTNGGAGGAGGVALAAFRAVGAVTLVLTGTSVKAYTVDVAAGCPFYALSTSVSGGNVPILVQAMGGIWNSISTSLVNDAAPAALLSYSVHGMTGGLYTGTPGQTLTKMSLNGL